MSAHTEGPWDIEFAASGRPRFITTRDGRSVIAEVGFGERAQADANLLAAAPDLLAALNDLLELNDARSKRLVDDESWEAARAAIAKAEGKP